MFIGGDRFFFTTRASRAAIQSFIAVDFVGSGPFLKIAGLQVWVVKEIDHHRPNICLREKKSKKSR
jgi:hypothetical protein